MNNNLNIEIGNRIKNLRINSHMTQEQLAEMLEISIKHMSASERGKACLSLEKLVQLCDFFNCSLDYLIRGTSENSLSSALPPSIINICDSNDSKEKELLNDFLKLYTRLREKN